MTALTADRDTWKRTGEVVVLPVAAATKIFAGSLVALNASGYATKGATATSLVAIGRAEETVDNSAGANGAKTVTVRRSVFRWENSTGGDQIGITEIGKPCWIVDDQAVAKTDGTGTRSKAGLVVDVETGGVWVDMTPAAVRAS